MHNEHEIMNKRYDIALQKLIDTRFEIFENLKHLYSFLSDRIVENYIEKVCVPLQESEESYCQAIYEIALEKDSELRRALPDEMTSEEKMNLLRVQYFVFCQQITGHKKKDSTFASEKLYEYLTADHK